MKISELRVLTAADYVGEFNLARNEREFVCKALILSKGIIVKAATHLRVPEKKVRRAIHVHGLQDVVIKTKYGSKVTFEQIEKMFDDDTKKKK